MKIGSSNYMDKPNDKLKGSTSKKLSLENLEEDK